VPAKLDKNKILGPEGSMHSLFMEGLLLQASLIFALGAQNLFILESGLRRDYHLTVSLICFLCDLALIMLGVAGAASLFNQFPILKILVGVVGVAFLFHYGLSKLMTPQETVVSSDHTLGSSNLKRSVLLAITFSVLNPHAYLDAFILIGGFATKYELLSDRITLGLGAACFSGIWFLMLSSASSLMQPLLANPRSMRRIMSVAGLVLVALSGRLGMDVYSWIQETSYPVLGLSYPQPPGVFFTSILY
jgi:L-lysine exporter family protein LysE/ArgO